MINSSKCDFPSSNDYTTCCSLSGVSTTPSAAAAAAAAAATATSGKEPAQQHQNEITSVPLHGVSIVGLLIDGQERLCLAQISNTLLKAFSYNEIHNRRVALGITCVQCTPVQLEMLRRAGAMPVSSRRCGMITKREAERLVKSFLDEIKPPRLPEDFCFDVYHTYGWGCRGYFQPSRYNSSRAKCIRCQHCHAYYSPNKFIFHNHEPKDPAGGGGMQGPPMQQQQQQQLQQLEEGGGVNGIGGAYRHPDAANFNAWRRHLFLSALNPSEELVHAWEDVKAMFNGGNRKRIVTTMTEVGSAGGVGGGEMDRRCCSPLSRDMMMEDGGEKGGSSEEREDASMMMGGGGGAGGGGNVRKRTTASAFACLTGQKLDSHHFAENGAAAAAAASAHKRKKSGIPPMASPPLSGYHGGAGGMAHSLLTPWHQLLHRVVDPVSMHDVGGAFKRMGFAQVGHFPSCSPASVRLMPPGNLLGNAAAAPPLLPPSRPPHPMLSPPAYSLCAKLWKHFQVNNNNGGHGNKLLFLDSASPHHHHHHHQQQHQHPLQPWHMSPSAVSSGNSMLLMPSPLQHEQPQTGLGMLGEDCPYGSDRNSSSSSILQGDTGLNPSNNNNNSSSASKTVGPGGGGSIWKNNKIDYSSIDSLLVDANRLKEDRTD